MEAVNKAVNGIIPLKKIGTVQIVSTCFYKPSCFISVPPAFSL